MIDTIQDVWGVQDGVRYLHQTDEVDLGIMKRMGYYQINKDQNLLTSMCPTKKKNVFFLFRVCLFFFEAILRL